MAWFSCDHAPYLVLYLRMSSGSHERVKKQRQDDALPASIDSVVYHHSAAFSSRAPRQVSSQKDELTRQILSKNVFIPQKRFIAVI